LADTNPVSLPAKNPLIIRKIIKAHERIIIFIIDFASRRRSAFKQSEELTHLLFFLQKVKEEERNFVVRQGFLKPFFAFSSKVNTPRLAGQAMLTSLML